VLNRNRRLRFEVATSSVGEISSVIRARTLSDVPRSALRLPGGELKRVGSEHILRAVDDLLDGSATAPFDTSLECDLITPDGHHLPPKAVFGLAATEALGVTAATVVIHYTQVWHPALELQASARAHRRGQPTESAIGAFIEACHAQRLRAVASAMEGNEFQLSRPGSLQIASREVIAAAATAMGTDRTLLRRLAFAKTDQRNRLADLPPPSGPV